MHNKKFCAISNVPSVGENFLLADENKPRYKFAGLDLKRCFFIRLGMKEAKVHSCVFHHCIFEECYFRNAEFQHVDFTGSLFKECNLHGASFEGCRFWYVRFIRCRLNYNEILQSVPSEPSIAIVLLKSLRQNAIEMGDKEDADRILLRQIKAEKQEFKNRFLARTAYYKKRYGPLERCASGINFLTLTLSGLLWGYGLYLRYLFSTALICIFVFALAMYKSSSGAFCGSNGKVLCLNFGESLYVSAVTFTSLGCNHIMPMSRYAYILSSVESFLGVIFLGFLAAAVYRKFAR